MTLRAFGCKSAPWVSGRELGQLFGSTNHRSGAGRGSRTPKGRSPADFESAASASSAIPALYVEVIDLTACSLFLFFVPILFSPKQHAELCNKVGRFSRFAQPSLILLMKCCDLFSGSDAHNQVLREAPFSAFYHHCQRIRFGPTVDRAARLYCFEAREQARHA